MKLTRIAGVVSNSAASQLLANFLIVSDKEISFTNLI